MKHNYDNLEDIIIFDNLISPAYQDWLYNMVNSKSFLWTRDDNATSHNIDELNDKRNGFANIRPLFVGKLDLKTFKCKDVKLQEVKLLNCFFPLLVEFIEPLNVN